MGASSYTKVDYPIRQKTLAPTFPVMGMSQLKRSSPNEEVNYAMWDNIEAHPRILWLILLILNKL